jgi:hypothetical protein
MEENKDKDLEKKAQEPVLDSEETVASAEDIAAFMQERRKAREEKFAKMRAEREARYQARRNEQAAAAKAAEAKPEEEKAEEPAKEAE